MGGGTLLNTGGDVESPVFTLTVVEACDTLPDASVAVKVTVVVPMGNSDGASLVTLGAASQMSVAVGSASLTAAPWGIVCSTSTGAGTFVMTCGVMSTTV